MSMSMSMTRSQWLTHCMGLNSGKRNRPVKKVSTRREQDTYLFDIYGRIYTETALTRSEARALLKKRLKLKRLPVGA